MGTNDQEKTRVSCGLLRFSLNMLDGYFLKLGGMKNDQGFVKNPFSLPSTDVY